MHLLIILILVLIIFGPGRLTDLGSSLGKAIKGFKNSMDEPEREVKGISETGKIDDKKG
jgi:sec-independent protein translocase protein TatA